MASNGNHLREKANWNPVRTKILLDICVDESGKGRQAGIAFRRSRQPEIAFLNTKWEEICEEFNKRANCIHTHKQLKSRLVSLRSDWILWKRLTGNLTHLGWNHHTGTIKADSEWWDAKIKENKKYRKFRYHGLEFRTELELIFGDGVTSQTAQSNESESDESSDKDSDSNVPKEDTESKSESDDEELNVDDECTPNTTTQSKKKRKTSEDIDEKVTDTKKAGFETSMRKIDRLVEATENNNDIAEPSYIHGRYSIPNCIEVLQNIRREGLLNDRQFSFALELLRNSQSRVILMSLKDSLNALVNWILYKYDM